MSEAKIHVHPDEAERIMRDAELGRMVRDALPIEFPERLDNLLVRLAPAHQIYWNELARVETCIALRKAIRLIEVAHEAMKGDDDV